MIVGRQLGVRGVGYYDGLMKDPKVHMHNIETFQQLWEE